MDEKAALLKAIAAAPDDDLPRLVYADWLDDQGNPRGELIRLEIAEARGEKTYGETIVRRNELRDEVTRNENIHEICPFSCMTERGFIEWISIQLDNFVKNHTKLFALEPITQVHLYPNPYHSSAQQNRQVQQLAGLPSLQQLRYLSVSGFTLPDVQTLVASPHLTAKTLGFLNSEVGDDLISALVTSHKLPQLEGLKLNNNRITAAGIERFGNKPLPLQTLDLSNTTEDHDEIDENIIGAEGARRLAHSRAFINLKELDISRCDIGSVGLAAIANAPCLRGLKKLILKDRGAILYDLAVSTGLPALEALEIDEYRVIPLLRELSRARFQGIDALPSLKTINGRPYREWATGHVNFPSNDPPVPPAPSEEPSEPQARPQQPAAATPNPTLPEGHNGFVTLPSRPMLKQ